MLPVSEWPSGIWQGYFPGYALAFGPFKGAIRNHRYSDAESELNQVTKLGRYGALSGMSRCVSERCMLGHPWRVFPLFADAFNVR